MWKLMLAPFFILFALSGCPGEEEDRTLAVSKENGTLEWVAVENAEYYTITHEATGDEHATTNTSVDLDVIAGEPGTHTFEVCSDNGYCSTVEYTKQDPEACCTKGPTR